MYHCAQLSHTTQHRAVLIRPIFFPLILQTSRAQILSVGGKEDIPNTNFRILEFGEGSGRREDRTQTVMRRASEKSYKLTTLLRYTNIFIVIIIKISPIWDPYGTGGRLLLSTNFKSRDTKN